MGDPSRASGASREPHSELCGASKARDDVREVFRRATAGAIEGGCGEREAARLDAIQGHAARTAGDSYGDVTVKAMAMAMERVPRVEV